jgi:hypothetical protein
MSIYFWLLWVGISLTKENQNILKLNKYSQNEINNSREKERIIKKLIILIKGAK